jgi:hypothetical protein
MVLLRLCFVAKIKTKGEPNAQEEFKMREREFKRENESHGGNDEDQP